MTTLNTRSLWALLASIGLGLFLGSACKSDEKFPRLGESLAGPVDVETSPTGNYFYVLNSDYERRFNEGSLMIIDPSSTDGNYKKTVIPTRRLGRSMSIGQNLLLMLYDDPEEAERGHAEIWSVADELNPTLESSWVLDCTPLSGIIAPSQPYFAISCAQGQLYMGTLGGARTLDLVRSYGYEHRALYFYEGAKTWLFGFPSDSDGSPNDDLVTLDKQSYVAASDQVIDTPNTVPDLFEVNPQARRRLGAPLPYQMLVYAVSDEEAASAALKQSDPEAQDFERFRFVEMGPSLSKPSLANLELLYVYYILRESDGQPTTGEGSTDLYSRIYRTNFWAARPGEVADTFYLSQRGNVYGSTSNNILRVQVNESSLARVGQSVPAGQSPVAFEDIFAVERVYGFSQDRDNPARYPGDFEYTEIDGEPMLLINHFRDLIRFRDAPFYAITRKLLSEPEVLERPASVDSTSFSSSFYQLAVSKSGQVLTCSFYGNTLFLFDARPRISMKDQTPQRIE